MCMPILQRIYTVSLSLSFCVCNVYIPTCTCICVCQSIYLYHVPGDGQKLPHTGMVIALLIGILLMGM